MAQGRADDPDGSSGDTDLPEPLTDGRLLLAPGDSLNLKTSKKVIACDHSFDHAPRTNQSRFPWAQTLVTVGLLRVIHGR